MRVNDAFSLEQLSEYFATPDFKRPFARYREEMLNPEPCFTAAESERLINLSKLNSAKYSRYSVSKLLIDLSWASSHLEGNTYTQLDTQALIEYGKKNDDKPSEDAAMILNHKRAIEFMVSSPAVTEENIKKIHAYLADNRVTPESRHFLEPKKCGVARTFTENGLFIDGTSYLPPQAEDRSPGFVNNEFFRLINSANALNDPINKSFFLMTRIPYLQVFYDANKRTSRVSCNIPLIESGLSPISFVDFDKSQYLKGLIVFYELGDERLAKDAFLDAYISSAFRYLPLVDDARFALSADREKHLSAAKRYVLDGVCDDDSIWLKKRNINPHDNGQKLDTPKNIPIIEDDDEDSFSPR
ncbi:Fic family protein [Candidatus Methylospira mobilis]|uniref:Fic family protein n=1 Tax=Candidatus Methylospira mobilis TaxID=1808979 RepID=UPI0028EA7C0D|nr:Fic family protein [Candidatus Methylospira mobilis]WNV05841.1 Fic family protein [Candidatus Methylospira mobilis]